MKKVAKSISKRVLTSLLAFTMLLGFCYVGQLDVYATQSQKGSFSTNYTLTGNGATDIVNVAKAQIGRVGSSFGYTESWCADFVSDCADLAGQSAAVPRHGHVDYLTSNLLNAGGTKYTNQGSATSGDIVFYDFNSNGSPDHVEIVSYVSGGKIYSIGGNTSYTNSVSTSKVSNERYCGYFLYFIRPNYSNSTPTPAPVVDPDIGYPEPTRNLYVQSPYMTGDDVRWVQKALSMLGYSISIDGIYGNDTKNAVASFQSNNGLTADGIVGSTTRAKIKECINSTKGHSPEVYYDWAVSNDPGKITVRGWAFDRDDTNAALEIHVYVGGELNSGAPSYRIWANKERTDVNEVFNGVGNYHGFEDTIEVDRFGEREIYIYAIGVGGGDPFVCLGNRTVNIQSPQIYDVTVSEVSSEGYRVTCKLNGTSAVKKIEFPTWTENNGQDDLIWHLGSIDGNTATCYIKTSDHNNEHGKYITHIYAWDINMNKSKSGTEVNLTDEPMAIVSGIYNGHEYTVYSSKKSWGQSKDWCVNHNGYLATITNEKEWNFVKGLLQKYNGIRCWLGAESTSGTWKWVTGEHFSFTVWSNGQPDNNSNQEFYLGTYGGGILDNYNWNDYVDYPALDYVGGFVIEKEIKPTNIQLSKDTLAVAESETINVSYSFLPENAAATVTWSSENTNIATVDNGNITGVKPGQTTINVKTDNGISSSIAVNVAPSAANEPNIVAAGVYNGHEYSVYNSMKDWEQAREWCANHGGYLATTTNENEWNFVKELLQKYNGIRCWLGAESTSRTWKWVTGETFDFSAWNVDQPDNNDNQEFYLGTHGGNVFNNYLWNDYPISYYDVCGFVMEKEIKPTEIKLSSNNVTLNEGESVNLSYSFLPKNTIANVTWSSENTSIATVDQGKITGVNQGQVIVTVTTDNGLVKNIIVNVTSGKTINNTSVINSDKVQIGNKVRVSASANGGTAPYTYAYYYKRSTNASWKTLGTEFGTTSSVSFAPTAEASYDIKVIVKDSTGTTAEKLFTVTAVKELELTNVSVLQRTNIKVGSAIPMIGKAVGGAGGYTYSFYFKRSTNTNWKLLGDKFGTAATARLKPTASGTYDIRIDVKDSNGTIVKKFLTATVK